MILLLTLWQHQELHTTEIKKGLTKFKATCEAETEFSAEEVTAALTLIKGKALSFVGVLPKFLTHSDHFTGFGPISFSPTLSRLMFPLT